MFDQPQTPTKHIFRPVFEPSLHLRFGTISENLALVRSFNFFLMKWFIFLVKYIFQP